MFAVELAQKALMISVFVAVMMLVVEYLNVWSRGSMTTVLQGSRLRQYLLAALLGATPGCLGAFVLVTLHVQRGISLGALVAGMIATSGDEFFIMLAMVPETALLLTGGLVMLGIVAGWLTDTLIGKVTHIDHDECCHFIDDHTAEDCRCIPEEGVLALWLPPRPDRLIVSLGLVLFIVALTIGWIGPDEWDWERIAFLAIGILGLIIVTTSSEAFFREHFWTHVARKHIPRLLAWTLGALIVIAMVEHFVDARSLIQDNRWIVLLVAAAIGIIPESGPHLLFVTLFATGDLPLSVLVTSSIVQDGHGMIPLLAHSRRDFLLVKGVNLVFGLIVGALMLGFGY